MSGFGYVGALALLYTGAGNFLLFDKGESANAPDRSVINLTTAGVATDTGFTTDHKVKGAVFFNHSTLGAAVTINSDGSFSYDPTVSATLQALTSGQSMVDTFSYIVVDAYGPAGAVGTVSTTVAFDVDTVTTITSDDPDPSFLGESVALVATVVGESGIPTGNVTFKDGTTSLGTVALIAGTATLNTTATPLGTRSITAEYAGLGGFNPSASGAEPHTVIEPPQLRISNPGDGTIQIEFSTLINRTYSVQYSSDLVTWNTVVPSIMGIGDVVQFIDDGPPKTESDPASETRRFYRIILVE